MASKYDLVLKCEMTEKDVRTGIPFSTGKCPVAKCVRRAARLRRVEVEFFYVQISSGKKVLKADVPAKVYQFIEKFDDLWALDVDRKKMKPISFTLRFEEMS